MNDEGSLTIDAQEAVVRTVRVEIQVLKIGNRQVTLSMFRQMLHEDVLNPEGNMRGTVWGFVNYHPSDCSYGDHLHFIWEMDGQLRRGTAYKITPHHYYEGPSDELVEAVNSIWTWQYRNEDRDYIANHPYNIVRLLSKKDMSDHVIVPCGDSITSVRLKWQDISFGEDYTPEADGERAREKADEIGKIHAANKRLWELVSGSDQLFIAT